MAKLKFQPQSGDVLIANRGLYKHFGIYIGNGRVIHYAPNEAGNELDPSKAIVHETTISGFMKKSGDIKIRKLADTKSPFTASEVIERARERLGETEYDLARNNCEHLANYCQTGENRSDQIDTVDAVLVGYGKPAVDIFETVLYFRSNWKTDKIGCMKFVGKKLKLNAELLLSRIPWHKIGEKLEAKIPQSIKDGVKDFIGKIIETGENLKGLAIAVTTGTAIAAKKGLLGLAKKDTPVGRIANWVSTALDKMHIMHQVGEKKLLPEKAITQIHNNETALTGYLVSKTKSNKKSIGDTLRETFGKTRAVVDVIAAPVVSAAKNAWQTVSKGFGSLVSKAWGGIKSLFGGRG